MTYRFALKEIHTKVDILNEKFQVMNQYNPIEHISTRLKTPESILKKIIKKGISPSIDHIQKNPRYRWYMYNLFIC
jgi:putative GTP pyrophosphokinase